jgi:hypothetical protein
MKEPLIQSGYLVLVDLSGYTSFMASSELDHAPAILANLVNLLRSRLTPALHLAEVEGDALFLYSPGYRMTRGETLLELIESTYVAFRDKRRTMRRAATCPCEACRVLPTLDLKFVTHCGEYVLQSLTGDKVKPFGTSVNLAHRLLKNSVTEDTGWQAYALFTEEALGRMCVRPAGMHESRVSYEHLGERAIGAVDLQRRFDALTAARDAYVSEDDAHFTLTRRLPLPASRVWEYLNDPHLRALWEIGADWSTGARPEGRTLPGSHNHCATSRFIEDVLDWRPFEYYTVRLGRGPFRFRVTGELRPDGAETDVRWSIVMTGGVPASMRRAVCRVFTKSMMRVPARFDRLARVAADDEQVIEDALAEC